MNFSSKVYNLTKKIPHGKISTYKIIANKLNSKAYRAVGQALKNNPHPIKTPCHRIISSNGNIGGYKGNQIKQKIKLLQKEGIKIKNNKILNFKKLLYKFK